jgi:hypothetical protein
VGRDESTGGRRSGFLCLLALTGAVAAGTLRQEELAGQDSALRMAARARQLAVEQSAARGDVALSRFIAAHPDPPLPSHAARVPIDASR